MWITVGYWRCGVLIESTLCYRPPPNLLRLEIEGAQIYLAVLKRTAIETGDEVRSNRTSEHSLNNDPENAETTSIGGIQNLREEAEKQLVSFCGHVLKEVCTLQPTASEAVHADYHRALGLRSPVTVQVLGATETCIYRFHAVFPKLQVSRPGVSTLRISKTF